MTDTITLQYFSGKNVTVEIEEGIPRILNGTKLTNDWFRLLSGAPDNSEIIVRAIEEDDFYGVGILVKNTLYEYDSLRIIYKDDDDKLRMMIRNHTYMLKREFQNKGIGLRSLAIQASAASNLGISALTADAAGDATSCIFNGYHSWPRMGFDAKLTDADYESLPESLRHCLSILDVLQTEEGIEWWKQPARNREMVFDLDKSSRSWLVLKNYMDEKGCQL